MAEMSKQRQKSARQSRGHAEHPDSIRALVIGGGAREHALVWRLHKSPSVKAVYTTHPQNPGINGLAIGTDFDFAVKEIYRVEQFVRHEKINLIVVGPEQPLAEGVVDKLAGLKKETGVMIVGPTASGAQLEADKAWAKKLMRAASIPTAEARTFRDAKGAIEYLKTRETNQVVKASGLAAGKGVFVPDDLDGAIDAVRVIMEEKRFGNAGNEVIIEEKLEGPEVSVFALIDGQNVVLLDACQDHKRLGEGDTGPNTGGMGAYCPPPDSVFTSDDMAKIARSVIVPVVDALKREDITYRGVLYAGLMMTKAGPKVLEFNVRFGDPECQCLVRRITGDFGQLMWHTAAGSLDAAQFGFDERPLVCVVLAAEGYPDNPVKNAEITGIEDAEAMEGVQVFHAGTVRSGGKLLTSGGRVLSITAAGDTVADARGKANAACEKIHFKGMQWRKDIAWQAVTAGQAV
jgi:phosphoribosylamine--glycine ligase